MGRVSGSNAAIAARYALVAMIVLAVSIAGCSPSPGGPGSTGVVVGQVEGTPGCVLVSVDGVPATVIARDPYPPGDSLRKGERVKIVSPPTQADSSAGLSYSIDSVSSDDTKAIEAQRVRVAAGENARRNLAVRAY